MLLTATLNKLTDSVKNLTKSEPSKPTIPFTTKLPQLPALPNVPRQVLASAKRAMPSLPFNNKSAELDILIIGAGASGVNMACQLKRDRFLSKSIKKGRVAIVDKRQALGGTWDLFKYPGIRSDSDMTTYSFAHRPWLKKETLADAKSIKQYIEETASEDGVESLIQFNTNVTKIEWSSTYKRWTATLEDVVTGESRQVTTKFIIGATGYYDFEQGYRPKFEGESAFKGQIIHPQQWDETVNYDNKRMVVIGSGATAVTLVPALTNKIVPYGEQPQQAAHVTMLQRTPTYVGTVPSEDNSLELLTKRFKLSSDKAYGIVRWKNILFQQGTYRLAQVMPSVMKKVLLAGAKKELKGSGVSVKHFKPDYNPWDERLCAVPDGDLFKSLHTDRAEIVTDNIERFTETGIQLKSGRHIPADIIVTATGLKLQMLGGAQVIIDGKAGDVGKLMTYKSVLVEGAPNLAVLFGYTNASWTLKIDLACAYIVKLLRHMYLDGYQTVVPTPIATNGETANKLADTTMGTLSSGYVQRAVDILPKQGDRYPWYVTNNYFSDIIMLKYRRIEDKWLRFGK